MSITDKPIDCTEAGLNADPIINKWNLNAANIDKLLQKYNNIVILLQTGSYNPVHESHIKNGIKAIDYLNTNYKTVLNLKLLGELGPDAHFIALFSASQHGYVQGKDAQCPECVPSFDCADRNKMLALALEHHKSNKNLMMDVYESTVPYNGRLFDFPDVLRAVQTKCDSYISHHAKYAGKKITVFYLSGADHFIKTRDDYDFNWVVIPRVGSHIPPQQNPRHIILNDLPEPASADASSTIRKALKLKQPIIDMTYHLVVIYIYTNYESYQLPNPESALIKKDKWFTELFGFPEHTTGDIAGYHQTQSQFIFNKQAGTLVSIPNGKQFIAGHFSTPTVEQLRAMVRPHLDRKGEFTFEHKIVGNILNEHAKYPNATFQGASQFNCLEMPGPNVIPEAGVTGYYSDNTQGPACALACAAGTIVRNYFVELDGQIGQTRTKQVNTLSELEKHVDNNRNNFWSLTNGYTNSTSEKLTLFDGYFRTQNQDDLISKIQIGHHADVGVTITTATDEGYKKINDGVEINVTQVYASALACGYSSIKKEEWTNFAKIVQYGMYEGTLWAGFLNRINHMDKASSRNVFLTLVGGGVFRNDNKWIGDAIGRIRALGVFFNLDIDLIVSYFAKIDDEIIHYSDIAYANNLRYFRSLQNPLDALIMTPNLWDPKPSGMAAAVVPDMSQLSMARKLPSMAAGVVPDMSQLLMAPKLHSMAAATVAPVMAQKLPSMAAAAPDMAQKLPSMAAAVVALDMAASSVTLDSDMPTMVPEHDKIFHTLYDLVRDGNFTRFFKNMRGQGLTNFLNLNYYRNEQIKYTILTQAVYHYFNKKDNLNGLNGHNITTLLTEFNVPPWLPCNDKPAMLVHSSDLRFLTAIDDIRIQFETESRIKVLYPVNKVLAIYHLFFPSRQDSNVEIDESHRHWGKFNTMTNMSAAEILEDCRLTTLDRVKLFSSYYNKTDGTNLFSSIILNGSIESINILIGEFKLMPSLPYMNNEGRLIMIDKYNPFFCNAIERLLQRNPSTYKSINEKLVLKIYRSFFIDYPPKRFLKDQDFYKKYLHYKQKYIALKNSLH
jgi:hypothetical protein